MKQDFTIVVFSADKSGLLHRVTTAFTKRHINIESLTVCKCEVPGISRYTITVQLEEDRVRKLVSVLEKHIEIFTVLYYRCLLYTSPNPRDLSTSRMPSSA